jgi:CRISPR/Cas system-associated exonuclease Cas4 (RecB family)
MRTLRVVASAATATRLGAAADFVRVRAPGTRVLIVGASRGAADDLARRVAVTQTATFGLERTSLAQLAARTALLALAAEGAAPSSWLGAEAVATRATFDALRDSALRYFAPVAGTPGFPRALARTLHELRMARVDGSQLAELSPSGADLAALLTAADACFADASSLERAELLRVAADVVRREPAADVLVLLDLDLEHTAERDFVAALVARAATTLATVAPGDREGLEAWLALGGVLDAPLVDERTGDLAQIRRHLFDSDTAPPVRQSDGSFELFSAPGEGREAVEIARRLLREARRGVPFDEMAILVRTPESYAGLLEHALGRAGVPAWYDRGTKRPHAGGRAFLALLACASEHLSAARFAEYLSLGQVPSEDDERDRWVASSDELVAAAAGADDPVVQGDAEPPDRAPQADDAIGSGTLRAPWRWERLLADAAVIGQDASRWRRRLEGREAELTRQWRELRDREGDDHPKVVGLVRLLAQVRHLRAFALRVIERLAGWPVSATWGEWLDEFGRLVPEVLRSPAHVLHVLADLRPMAAVGPIGLDEARRVLTDRLLTVEAEPPSRRFGRVFVGTPQQARGRSFRVVFVPGLAERMFPQKPREDPLLLDGLRRRASASLGTQHRRLLTERGLLQLAAGSASERLYVSYPRIDLAEARVRVPSFYALDLWRAVTGRVPDHETLEERAREAGNATLAWPAPSNPDEAIDIQEHDLAVLRGLLDHQTPAAVRGHAHYLLKLNESLRRSVVARWARGERRWSLHDGTIAVTPHTAAALEGQRLTARSYSASALQRFSACPYQFVLAAFYRLQPLEQPESLQRMDPLTRGSLFHEVQAAFLGRLRHAGALPVTADGEQTAHSTLDEVVTAVADRARDELAPAVERVWQDEITSIRRDLHGWLDHLVRSGAEWTPRLFEWAFGAGSVPGERDPASVLDDAVVEGGFRLRGAIDLVEEHRQTGVLRVTDHKTGRKPDRIERVITGGGAVLQPVLYPMAVEAALGKRAAQGRLFYCTAAGGFYEHAIALNDNARAAGAEVLRAIDRAIQVGALAAAPTEDACGRCDFRAVCGPDVARRVRRKPQEFVADLAALRGQP